MNKMAKNKTQKTVTVTMTFTSNEVYPADDFGSLQQNVFYFLNDNLICNTLSKKLNITCNEKMSKVVKDALIESNEVDEKIAREMVKSLKVSVN